MSGIQIISYTLAILGTAFLGLLVLQNNSRSKVNRAFAFLNFSIVLWLSALLLADTTASDQWALFFVRTGVLVSNFMPIAFVMFCRSFASEKRSLSWTFFVALVLMSPFLLGSFSDFMVSRVIATQSGAEIIEFGPLYSLQTFFVVGLSLYGFSVLWRYSRNTTRQIKNQINFILTGISIALVANLFSGFIAVLAGYNAIVAPVGVLSLLVSSGFITYSIVRHKLFDIRSVVARSVAYVAVVGTLAVVYSVFIFGLSGIFFTTSQVGGLQQIAYVAFAILLAITFQPLKRIFDRITNKLFYRDAYDPQLFVSRLNTILASTIDLDILLGHSSRLIADTLKADFCYFEVDKTAKVGQVVVGTDHTRLTGRDISEVQKTIGGRRGAVILNDYLDKSDSRLKEALDKHGIAVFIRLRSGGNNEARDVGSLVLGFKKSGNLYGSQDVKILETVAKELAIAVQNALRFEEIRRFSETLQDRVDAATSELRVANSKLKEIDKAKDDFISMASHQLRTPLTSIKGYLSMVLDGDVGRITPTQRKVMEEAYTSSQRMVYLIGDFLNVSRIQTGKFMLERVESNLAAVLTDEIDQLRTMAQTRRIEIEYVAPSHFPMIFLDQEKFRQVMMNFIDNAIYYSRSDSSISVSITRDVNEIVFKVTDHGIGVPAGERHKLFTKFYRASNAKKQRPDGTGIGLFMAQKVVVAHGGSVIFESKENEGSTFGFRLPLQAPQLSKDNLK